MHIATKFAAVLVLATAATGASPAPVALIRHTQCMGSACQKGQDSSCVTRVYTDSVCDLAGYRRVCRRVAGQAAPQLDISSYYYNDCQGNPTKTLTVKTGVCSLNNATGYHESFDCDMEQQPAASYSNIVFTSASVGSPGASCGQGNETYFSPGQCTAPSLQSGGIPIFCSSPECNGAGGKAGPTPFIVSRYYAGNTSAEYVTFELHKEKGCKAEGAPVYALPADRCFTNDTPNGAFITNVECY